MKLKTLNDIYGNLEIDYENPEDYELSIPIKKLRKEAIKWIKYLENNGNGGSMMEGQIHTYKLFFNITEEDLK